MEIAKKITFLFAILSAIIISLLSGFVWYFSNEFAFEDFYKRLEARVNITAQIKASASKSILEKVRNQYLERLPDEKEYILERDHKQANNAQISTPLPSSFYEKINEGKMARYRKENHFYAGKYFGNKD